ncbi:MAG TPA: hypothetical protein VF516_41310 [Kofleriaceae bacterium]
MKALSRLSKLLPSQFEQVLYVARIPHEQLPRPPLPGHFALSR